MWPMCEEARKFTPVTCSSGNSKAPDLPRHVGIPADIKGHTGVHVVVFHLQPVRRVSAFMLLGQRCAVSLWKPPNAHKSPRTSFNCGFVFIQGVGA